MSVLAWRSYVLSVRTERGTATLAKQYAAYAADITAGRVDAAVRNELQRASDDWQQVERRPPVTRAALQTWMHGRDWITAAIFLPDADPSAAIYAAEKPPVRQTLEIYGASGVVRYMYDPARLLARARAATGQPPVAATREL